MRTFFATLISGRLCPGLVLLGLVLVGGLAAPMAAQEQGPEKPADLAALAALVDRAHHPDGPVEPIVGFKAALSIELVAAEAEQAGQVDLGVRYLRHQREGRKRATHFIRYDVKGTDREIERGFDAYGPWQLEQGKAANITEADTEDRAALREHTMLARQLVRFLDPAAVLRSLGDPTPIAAGEYTVGRRQGIPCWVVEGSLERFPLQRLGGAEQAVRLEVLVRQSDGRLIAVRATPVVAGKPIPAQAEMVRFDNYKPKNGLLVPKGLLVSHLDAAGKWRSQSRVLVTELDLRPELTPDDFARPK